MSKKQEWEKVGGGSFGVYKPKPKKKTDWGEVIGGIFIVMSVLAVLSSCN